ncbi:unnamed protein product [Vitrella brassicaformis CCMP3155]|uniref:MORN repeat-containing protein 5 n=1 Tax=Vitrella brassicaformis (strain CCMP3155) TaxID=1169540 RepID=A0A0G4EP77_VITBC|nr:unnamed protein product [Vitrella brassicaformis CCMP3155]|eukprot:CEL99256.1 unnamed protein product [Vitrella brassicaformis CCMP3155]
MSDAQDEAREATSRTVPTPASAPTAPPPSAAPADAATVTQSTSRLSGTSYEGPLKNGWFEGSGRYRFPNGVVYEGQFHKGEFHGDGSLIYPNGGRYVAKWDRGFAVGGQYVFNDGLLYQDRGWQYLTRKDRRFYSEVLHGLQPAGNTLLTNEVPSPLIPYGCFDTGNGYFEPELGHIISYDGHDVLSVPTQDEMEWILTYCRKGFDVKVRSVHGGMAAAT